MTQTRIRILWLMLLFCIPPNVAFSTGPVKVAILPFEVNAPEDLNYLREGAMDMLNTRITGDAAEVIEKKSVEDLLKDDNGRMNEKKALKIGETLKADYIIFGSITIFRQSASIDTQLMDLKNKKTRTFFREGAADDLILKFDEIGRALRQEISGEKVGEKSGQEISKVTFQEPVKPVEPPQALPPSQVPEPSQTPQLSQVPEPSQAPEPPQSSKPLVKKPRVFLSVRTYLSASGTEKDDDDFFSTHPALTEGKEQNIWKFTFYGERFFIKIKNLDSFKTKDFPIRGDGNLFLDLAPGKYEICGWRWRTDAHLFKGGLGITFNIPEDTHVYIGTLKLKSTASGDIKATVIDEYHKFDTLYPSVRGRVVKDLMKVF